MKNKMFVVSAGVLALTGLSANATISVGPITTAPDGSGGVLWTYPIIFVNTTISSTQPTSFTLNDFGVLKTTGSLPTGFIFSPGVAFTLDNSQNVGPSFGLPGFQGNNAGVKDVVITFTANASMELPFATFNLVLDTALTGTGGPANFFSQDIDLAGTPNAAQQNILTPTAQGQGIVRFDNRVVNAPFYDSTGTNRLAGANFVAGLYAGALPSSLSAVGSPQVFNTGALAGFWQPINAAVPFAPGSTIQVQVRVWNAAFATFDDATLAGASFGITPVFSIVLNLNASLPTPLTGLQSIGLVQGFDPVPVGLVPPITLTRGLQFLNDPMKASNGSLTDLCGVPVGLNRWFLAKPTTTGMAIFSTEGSQIDTVMGVYSNDVFNNVLVCPACWSDNQSASSTFSEVRVPVQTGTLYRICLAGKNGAVGDLHLNYCVQSELTINPLPNAQVQLSWPSEANGFVLQTTKTPSVANSWSTLAGVPTVVNNVITLSVNASDSAFYRLYHSLP